MRWPAHKGSSSVNLLTFRFVVFYLMKKKMLYYDKLVQCEAYQSIHVSVIHKPVKYTKRFKISIPRTECIQNNNNIFRSNNVYME